MIKQNSILITGGTGMVGTELQAIMPGQYYIGSKQCDLTNQQKVNALLTNLEPDGIIHLAARVGGIQYNLANPVSMFDDNVLMNTLLVKAAYEHSVKRFIGILSTCIYPNVNPKGYPMLEEHLHDGPPAESNFSYGVAKRALATQIHAYNQQYGLRYQYLIPANLYGLHDKYGDHHSHFVAALIKKIHRAVVRGEKTITLFGSGQAMRQFMFAEDLARIIKICLDAGITENMNICSDECYSIANIANIALRACKATHLRIVYDKSKPDGQMKKTVSNELLKSILPGFTFTSLYDGIERTYKHYCEQYEKSAGAGHYL